jgi:sec-independent protein translocase protein TatA
MLSNLTGWHFLIILVIVLLLFGAPKLPALARSLGQSMKIFKNEIRSDEPAETKSTPGTDSAPGADAPDPTTKQ